MTHSMKTAALLLLTSVVACTGRSRQETATTPAPAPKEQPGQGTQPSSVQPEIAAEQPETQQELPGTSENTEQVSDDIITEQGTTTTTTTTSTTSNVAGQPASPPAQVTPPTPPPPANNPTGTIDIQGDAVVFQDLNFKVPPGWKIHQDTFTEGTLIMAFTKGPDYFRIYARKGALPSLQTIFVNGSQVVKQERGESVAGREWKRIDTQKGQVSVSGFGLTHNGHAYYGFGRSTSQQAAAAITTEFLGAMK